MPMKRQPIYSLEANGATQTTVTDGASRFFGHMYGMNTSASGGVRRMYIPCSGKICCALVDFFASTIAGSNETFNCYIRLNDTTDYLIASVATTDVHRIFSNTKMNIPVVVGDFIEIKFIYPTWATNPTEVLVNGTVIVKRA